jgi:hypothetical protein
MSDSADKLTAADPRDLADAIAFSLRFKGRNRVHQADGYMAPSPPSAWCAIWSALASSS